MAQSQDFNTTRGTVLAIFAQNGTYSAVVDLGGGWLVGAYSDDWPGGAGSFTVRASFSPSGTGWPVQTVDGTVLRIASSGSGTFNTLGHAPWNTAPLQYVRLQVGTAGTVASGGGTYVLVTGV
jgi:hypothetical protein